MKVVAKIFYLLLKWFDIYKQKKIEKKKQVERDELEKDPHNWFSDHFDGGVRNVPDRHDKPSKTDTKSNKNK